MSVDALSWAFRLKLAPTEKLVLLAYADRAGEFGDCYPSSQDTQDRTGLAESTIRLITRRLGEMELLTVAVRRTPSGRQTSNGYSLAIGEPGQAGFIAQRPRAPVGGEGPGDGPLRGHDVRGGGATTWPPEGPPRGPPEPSLRTVKERTSTPPSPSLPGLGLGAQELPPSDPIKVSFGEWYRAYPRKKAPDAAERAYRAALKRGATPGGLLRALKAASFSDDPQFVPHPATWLNQGRWRDAPESNSSTPNRVNLAL